MIKLYINEKKKMGRISPEIYGHFSEHLGRCIYEGLYVGEDSPIPNVKGIRTDVVEALREIRVPVLRWPGGCFADEYHWKDGIGPKEKRKKMVNTHWGGVVEDNSFGTHEFFELCEQIGCKAYVNGNVGSGTVQEMSEWVEYMTFDGISPMADLRKENGREKPWRLDYFGVGNENWGCGGNMTPDYYAHLYRRYQTYVRCYDKNAPVFKICGGANADDYEWTDVVLRECFRSPAPPQAHGFMDGLSVHYYVGVEKGEHKGSATEFDEARWFDTLSHAVKMEELINRHGAIMDRYDPEKKIGMIVDEWFLYQQNTMRDALTAGITLNIFNRHCDRVKMACIAQMVNVLQAVILTEGPRMVKTPTWYVFHMYRHHQGAQLVESFLEGVEKIGMKEEEMVPNVQESVSVDEEGVITITLNNLSLTQEQEMEIVLEEKTCEKVEATLLCGGMRDYNTFDMPERVKEECFKDYQRTESGLRLRLPACSVLLLG